MNVYVVSQVGWNSSEVIQVFLDRNAAEAYCEFKKDEPGNVDEYEIESFVAA